MPDVLPEAEPLEPMEPVDPVDPVEPVEPVEPVAELLGDVVSVDELPIEPLDEPAVPEALPRVAGSDWALGPPDLAAGVSEGGVLAGDMGCCAIEVALKPKAISVATVSFFIMEMSPWNCE